MMTKLLRRIRYWFHARREDAALAEELEFHRTMKQEALEQSGMTRESAGPESRRALGNVLRAREEARDVWGWTRIQDFARDIAYAFRTIRRMPAVSLVIVISLGIGIGVNAAVFSWLETLVLNPIPGVANASSFYLVEPRSDSGSYPGTSWPEYKDLKERMRSFETLIAFRGAPVDIGDPASSDRRAAQLVSENYFTGLGLIPAIGRFIAPDEAAEGKPVAVISQGFWKAKYASDAGVLGRPLRINDQVVSIVGVAPEGFQGTVMALDVDMWLPASLAPVLFNGSRELEDRTQRGYSVIGRVRSGSALAEAQTELHSTMQQLASAYPDASARFDAEMLPYWKPPRGPQRFLAAAVTMLQGVMLVLLLAVCGNIANLLLARAASRAREVGTRLAIGATRGRILRLLLSESIILGSCGSLIGIAIAFWGTESLRAVRLYMAIPIRFQTAVDQKVLVFSVLLGLACAVLFGAAPAFQLAAGDPQSKLRLNAASAPNKRLRNGLMAAESALALMVLLAAALFFESFRDTRTVDPGFQVEGVLLSAYDLTGGHSAFQGTLRIEPEVSRGFANDFLQRLQALPGVESAAIASQVPLDIHGFPLGSFTLEGAQRNDEAPNRALTNVVTPDYFRTMRMPLLDGPGFVALSDTTAPAQVIVNQEFVRRFLSGVNPIGRKLQRGSNTYVIAGIVKNSFYDAFGEAPIPITYYSYRDRPRPSGEVHLRTQAGAETLIANDVRRVLRELQPAQPLLNVRSLQDHVETNLFLRRIPARLFIVLGPLLLVFAAIGIYSVVAYNVAHRTTEIGVRIALGATARHVISQIVGETMRIIVIGAVVGLFVTVMVYIHVVPGGRMDLRVFVGVPAALLLVSAFSSWLPARRSATLDPMTALREE